MRKPPRITIQSYDEPETWFVHDYIRKVYLTVSGWTLALDTKNCDLSPFDHFTKKQIVRDFEHPERRLDSWGKTVPGGRDRANEVGTKRHE